MADRVELIVQLTGNQQAISSLREMQQLVNSLNTKKVQLKLDAAEIDRQLADKKRMLQELTARRHDIKLSGGDVTQVSKDIDKLKDEISELTRQKKHIAIDARLNTEALSQGNAELRDMERNANTVADAIKGIGSALSTVGGLSSTIGSIFGQMASLAGGNMMNTVVRTLTGYGTILATQGLGTASSRFDTFRTFPRVMEVMGYSVDQTDAAVKRLEQSVLGLPTSLNDIIDMARDFILLTNDLDRGVDLATSINNLFVAGGADSEQVRIGLKQFRDLLSKGSLMDREWDSLARTLGVSLRFIASEAGYAEEQFGEFRAALKSGEIGVEEFLDAVVRAGSSGRVKSVLEEMKDTLTATLTNLRTAFANLGATVLTEFDNLLSRKTGGGLPDTILSISNAIKQQLIPAVREWIAINSDRLFAVFDWIRSFDWGSLLRGIADNVLYVVEKLLAFADAIGHENIVWFFSHGTQWAMMARQFQILGAALSALGGIVSTVGTALGGLKTVMEGISAAGGLAAVGSAAAPYLAVAGAVSIGIGLIIDGYKRGTAAAKEYTDAARTALEGTELSVANSKALVESIDQIITSQATSFDVLEKKATTAKALAQEIIALGAAGDTAGLAKSVAELQALFPDIKVELDEVTGRLTLNGRAAAEAAAGYIEYVTATEKAQIAAKSIQELLEEEMHIEVQIEANDQKIAELKEQLAGVREAGSGQHVNIFESIEYQKAVKELQDEIAELEGQNDSMRDALERAGIETGIWTEKMQAATDAARDNAGAVEAITQAAEATGSELDALEAKYEELKKVAHESFEAQIKGFGELEQAATEKIGSMTEAQNKNAEYIGTYSDNLRTLLDYIEEQGESLSPNVARMLSEAVSEGLSGAGSVAAIAEAIEADDDSFKKLAAAYEKEFLAAAEAADLTAAIQTVAESFTEAYDQLIKEGSLFGENGLTIFSETDIENIKQEASTVVQALQDGINEIFAGGEDAAQGITLFSEDTIKAMITPMYEALANEDTGLTASFIALKEIMVSLYDETVPELIEAFEELLEAVEELREAVEELTEAIEDLIDAIEELIAVLKDAKKETDGWRTSIERLIDVINEAIPVVQSLTGEIDAFRASVSAAIAEVNALAAAIASLGDMSVSVPSAGGGGSGFNTHTSGNRAVPYSTGGPVYLAGGGSLWIPKGTDTVPAMLTPGEFVLRRKAVQKVGLPFLNMLNRLDIPRAIDALMSRVVLPSGMNYVTYDNRRSYDNHATVNQHIYTNNPDYAYRRASRWAHAL